MFFLCYEAITLTIYDQTTCHVGELITRRVFGVGTLHVVNYRRNRRLRTGHVKVYTTKVRDHSAVSRHDSRHSHAVLYPTHALTASLRRSVVVGRQGASIGSRPRHDRRPEAAVRDAAAVRHRVPFCDGPDVGSRYTCRFTAYEATEKPPVWHLNIDSCIVGRRWVLCRNESVICVEAK